jgi:uncharacterized membrane-anchored protein
MWRDLRSELSRNLSKYVLAFFIVMAMAIVGILGDGGRATPADFLVLALTAGVVAASQIIVAVLLSRIGQAPE